MPLDVFISYSSKDRPWAVRLDQDLRAKGLDIFLDISELQAGSSWKAQLTTEMQNARYFVGLWSGHARESRWVDHEVTLFQTKLSTVSGSIPVNQRTIFILLNEENVPYNDLQMITELKDANVYSNGIDEVHHFDPNLWPRVVEKVYQAVTNDEISVPIPLLILTTTTNQLGQLDSTRPPAHLPHAESLDNFLNRMGMAKSDLVQRYGMQRTEWKPFGTPYDIITLLNQERDNINNLPGTKRIRWEPLGAKFWSGTQEEMLTEIRKVFWPKLAVIVIDPLSFYDGEVYGRFTYLRESFDNENATVIVLAPFLIADSTRAFREAIQRIAWDVYRDYYEPGVRRVPYARCSISFGDDLDIRRSLLATLRSYFNQVEPKPSSLYTQMAGTPQK
jgi:hypothetical protein